MNMKLFCNKLVNRHIKRLRSSNPDILLSNCAKIYLEKVKTNNLSYFMEKNKIKCVHIDYKEEENHIRSDYFLYDIESLKKILNTRDFPFTFQTISTNDGSVSTSNRITIQHEDDLCERIKSLLPKEYFISTKLPHKRFHHIYCQNEDQFNALFFQNGIQKNVLIERTHFPYIKNLTLKISPNIINVYFPEEIETEEKASNFFSDLRFNKIVKPTNPKAPWKFYLSNKIDYLKMLSQPYFYMNKCLLILPHYGSPIYLYDGEKKVGNTLMMYSMKDVIKIYNDFGKLVLYNKSGFENGLIVSISGHKITLDKLRFSNGLKIDGVGDDYTLVFGDKINKLNISSPFLQIRTIKGLDLSKIKSEIAPFIYDSDTRIAQNLQYLNFLPLSFKHYLDLLKLSLKVDGIPILMAPYFSLSPHSYLSNCIFVPDRIYEEKKEDIEKLTKPVDTIKNKKGYILSYKTPEITDALFLLARYDKFSGLIQRISTPIIKSDCSLFSNKVINISAKNLDLVNFNYFQLQPYKLFKIGENDFRIIFEKIEHAFPYLFKQSIETNKNTVQFAVSLRNYVSKTSLISVFPPDVTMNLMDFWGIKYIISDQVEKDRFLLKIETFDDLYNVISMVDEFNNTEKENLRFCPGPELKNI